MCNYQRWIYNAALRQKFLVKCGRCEPCLQEKADKRVLRINNEWLGHSGKSCYFVELDYTNDNVPYILKSDADYFLANPHNRDLFVYRANKCIQVLTINDFMRHKVPDFSRLHVNPDFLQSLTPFRHSLNDKIGVLYKRDIQLFFKRLKINLVRAGYTGYLSYFYCSDYGGKYKRPHFHFLIYFDKESTKLIYDTICQSWSFTDLSEIRLGTDGKWHSRIEVARNPAKYVASYVNSTTFVSSFLSQTIPFKPMYHFSNGFGCSFDEFQLPSIVEKIYRGSLTYRRKTIRKGVCVESDVLIPKYIISRYFPKFKGFSTLSPDEIYNVAIQPYKFLRLYKRKLHLFECDIMPIVTKLLSLRNMLCKLDSDDDFYRHLHSWAFCYTRVWSIYYSLLLKQSYQDILTEDDLFEHFDNINDYFKGGVRCDYLDSLNYSKFEEFQRVNYDPHFFVRTTTKNIDLIRRFRRQKHHHEINYLYYE